MSSKTPESLRTIPSATGGITRLACARLSDSGRDAANLLIRVGLAPEAVKDPAVRLDARAQVKLLELAAQELGDDLLGFHLAQGFDVREIGLVYYVMASSERLADALVNAERYSRIVNDGIRLRVTLGQGATVALDHLELDRRIDRHHIEFWIVTLVRICREIAGSRFAPRRLRMRHVRPTLPAAFRSFFGVEVEFGCEADEIVFSSPVALLPATGRDTHLNLLLRRYADEALASRHSGQADSRSAVERLLPEMLPHGKASAKEVARRLGTSSRSLSRKLQMEGTTFAEMLDELRRALAERYLAERRLSISEIAWLLGYREVSSLTHAFKRWTGTTPRQFRLNRDGKPSARTASTNWATERGKS